MQGTKPVSFLHCSCIICDSVYKGLLHPLNHKAVTTFDFSRLVSYRQTHTFSQLNNQEILQAKDGKKNSLFKVEVLKISKFDFLLDCISIQILKVGQVFFSRQIVHFIRPLISPAKLWLRLHQDQSENVFITSDVLGTLIGLFLDLNIEIDRY